MPESVTDRPTKAHEYVFLLTKSPRYFYDADAIREPHEDKNYPGTADDPAAGYRGRNGLTTETLNPAWRDDRHARPTLRVSQRDYNPAGRNKRSVWEIATEPYPDAHFATYPTKLVEPCILAGTSERGCCPECGAPWERQTDVEYEEAGKNNASLKTKGGGDAVAAMSSRPYETRMLKHVTTTGWAPTCDHHLEPVACVVLDPFLGSGTTAVVARKHGRRCVGIELSPEYAALAARRLSQLSLLAEATA
jgi:hypothetical protein